MLASASDPRRLSRGPTAPRHSEQALGLANNMRVHPIGEARPVFGERRTSKASHGGGGGGGGGGGRFSDDEGDVDDGDDGDDDDGDGGGVLDRYDITKRANPKAAAGRLSNHAAAAWQLSNHAAAAKKLSNHTAAAGLLPNHTAAAERPCSRSRPRKEPLV